MPRTKAVTRHHSSPCVRVTTWSARRGCARLGVAVSLGVLNKQLAHIQPGRTRVVARDDPDYARGGVAGSVQVHFQTSKPSYAIPPCRSDCICGLDGDGFVPEPLESSRAMPVHGLDNDVIECRRHKTRHELFNPAGIVVPKHYALR